MVQMPVDQPAANPAGPGGGNIFEPAAAGAPTAKVVDQDWATAFFTIPMKELASSFQAAGIVAPAVPPLAQQTLFLEVVGQREEQIGVDDNGEPIWGNLTTLKPLPNVNLLPLPAPQVGPNGQLVFQDWAEKHQDDILQPAFFPVTDGDLWHEPGIVMPVANKPVAPANPAVPPLPGDPNHKMTPAEIKAQRDAERKQKAEQEKALREQKDMMKRVPRGSGGPPRVAPSGGGAHYQAFDPNRASDPRFPPRMPPADPRMPARMPPTDPRGGGYPPFAPMPNAPADEKSGLNPQDVASVPKGLFIPSPQLPDVVTWVHDNTVKPGKTYRYRIMYAIKNPVYNTNIAGPNIVGVFALKQDENHASDWTEPVSIATRTQFFIASLQQNKASITVFRWQNGHLNSKDFTVQPGDLIGAVDNGVDFSTGQTLVDIRDGSVLVMDDQNILHQRSFDTDQKNPEFRKMRDEAVAPPSGEANAGMPGAFIPR
jgi:hypothetical protein